MPSLVGWTPSLVGWRPLLLGWRPSLLQEYIYIYVFIIEYVHCLVQPKQPISMADTNTDRLLA